MASLGLVEVRRVPRGKIGLVTVTGNQGNVHGFRRPPKTHAATEKGP